MYREQDMGVDSIECGAPAVNTITQGSTIQHYEPQMMGTPFAPREGLITGRMLRDNYPHLNDVIPPEGSDDDESMPPLMHPWENDDDSSVDDSVVDEDDERPQDQTKSAYNDEPKKCQHHTTAQNTNCQYLNQHRQMTTQQAQATHQQYVINLTKQTRMICQMTTPYILLKSIIWSSHQGPYLMSMTGPRHQRRYVISLNLNSRGTGRMKPRRSWIIVVQRIVMQRIAYWTQCTHSIQLMIMWYM